MAKSMPKHLERYNKEFKKHLGEVDELQQYILKGHLVIESILDNVIKLIFFHPEHIQDGRFGFMHKVNLARAFALNKNKSTTWKLVVSINAVRNEIAHQLGGEKRDRKMQQLRRLYIAELEDDRELIKAHKEYPDELIAVMACALSAGFLATLEDDLKALRKGIDKMSPKKREG